MEKKPLKKENHSTINLVAVISCFGAVAVVLSVLLISGFIDKQTEDGPSEAEEYSYIYNVSEQPSREASGDISAPTHETSEEISESVSEEPSESAVEYQTVYVGTDQYKNGTLVLVNAEHPLWEEYEIQTTNLYSIRNGEYKLSDSDISVNSKITDKLTEMLGKLYTCTGKNSLTIVKGYSADDKTNEYATGLTFHAVIYPAADGSLDSGSFLWLPENAWEYGFIVRYPADTSSITGHESSNNFYRYVGIPHSYLMTLNTYTLEEYLEFCTRFSYDRMFTFSYDGINYGIYYVPATEGTRTAVNIPADCEYTISGDNIGGYIITCVFN